MGRTQWANDANTILSQDAYCNIALEAYIDEQTRQMTVDVEVYYTIDSPASSNFINIALLQDNVVGPQVGSSANPSQQLSNGQYNYMHMLRHLITGQWGDEITTVTQGTLVQRQYTYTLPADINGVNLDINNIKIVGFVAEGHQEIVTGSEGVLYYSSGAEEYDLSVAKVYPNPSSGSIFIENATGMQLQIFDINGGLVYQKNNLTQKENFQLNLSNGIYLAKFMKDDKVAVKKIIITK